MIKLRADLMNGGKIEVTGKNVHFCPMGVVWGIAVDGVVFPIPKEEVCTIEMSTEGE